MRDQSRRVLILGSGPQATALIEEIESAQTPRYIVCGTVDDQEPAAGAPYQDRWLGPCDSLPEIINRVHPAFIAMVRDLLLERAALDRGENPVCAVVGRRGPNPHVCPADCCPNLRVPLPAVP